MSQAATPKWWEDGHIAWRWDGQQMWFNTLAHLGKTRMMEAKATVGELEGATLSIHPVTDPSVVAEFEAKFQQSGTT